MNSTPPVQNFSPPTFSHPLAPPVPVWGIPVDGYASAGVAPSQTAASFGLAPPGRTPSQAEALLGSSLANACRVDPPMLCCAMSGRLMLEPVLADDGYTYERDLIENFLLTGEQRSPITEQLLRHPTLVTNANVMLASQALTRWRQAGAPGDVRAWVRPAIIAPDGNHNPLRQPMTLSDGSTCEATALAALFEHHRVRSPYTQRLWTQHFEDARPNRAIQALSAAVIGFEPPAFADRRRYPTWSEPVLEVPPPSSRRPYRAFCCDYRGLTLRYQPLACVAAFVVGCPVTIVASLPTGAGIGVGAGACGVVNAILRTIDYAHYRQANEEGAALYDEKLRASYEIFNAQRQIIGLPPVSQAMQR